MPSERPLPEDLESWARELGGVDDVAAALADISDAALGELLGALTTAYARRRQGGGEAPAFASRTPNATEVAVTVSAMLEQVGIEVFELGMWRSWGFPIRTGADDE